MMTDKMCNKTYKIACPPEWYGSGGSSLPLPLLGTFPVPRGRVDAPGRVYEGRVGAPHLIKRLAALARADTL